MARTDRLLDRLRQRPRDFTWDELVRLLGRLGFAPAKGGRTSGSRQRFVQASSGLTISLHRPHPGSELKRYQVDQVLEFLEREGLIR
ncbi:MAG: type II toxin-antitoxin system HicA family toxin [Candidatus Latescibacterota bacterium]